MSVVIKGMDMPKRCYSCNLSQFTDVSCEIMYCFLTGHEIDEHSKQRHENCPFILLPQKHGRLIDADELIAHTNKILGDVHMIAYFEAIVNSQPTIIEAEDGE